MQAERAWRQVLQVCRGLLMKLVRTPKMLMIVIFIGLFIWVRVSPVRTYCMEQNLAVTSNYFPFLFMNEMSNILFFLGIILLLSEAPFLDSQQLFVLQRVGSRRMLLGQMLCVFLLSVGYFLMMYVVSVVEFVPYVGFSTSWGAVIEELSYIQMVGDYGVCIPRSAVQAFHPLTANILIFVIAVMLGTMIGLFLMLCNLSRHRNLGIGISSALVLVSVFGFHLNVWDEAKYKYVSFVGWTKITLYGKDNGLPVPYVIGVLAGIIVVLICLNIRQMKKFSYDMIEEV